MNRLKHFSINERFEWYTAGNKAVGCTLNDKEKQIHQQGYNSIQVSYDFPCTV